MDDAKALEIKEIFRDIIPDFGINHARVYYCLLSSETKTGKDIIRETEICKSIVYAVLKDLMNAGLVHCNNSSPAIFFMDDPIRKYAEITKNRTKELEKGLRKLEKIIGDDSAREDDKYLLVVGKGRQTKLINYKTKMEISTRDDASKVKEIVNKAVDRIVTESLIKG